jgi:hypothetical protein
MFESIPQRRSTDSAAPDAERRTSPNAAEQALPSAHELLEQLLEAAPSASAVPVLHAIDPRTLDDHDRVSWLCLWDRQRNWMDACGQDGLVAVGGLEPRGEDPRDDWAREDVACALRLSSSTAGDRLAVARQLCGRLRATKAAMADGALTYAHGRALVDALAVHGDEVAAVVEEHMLTAGYPDETLTNWRRRLARAVIAADPASADERHEAACKQRRVVSFPESDGMASILATLSADEAATTMRALTALAGRVRADGDGRPIDFLRADAFSAVFAAALASPDLPTAQRARPWIGVTIDSATLMRLADNPAHLEGYGAIPPAMARRIAAGGDWHRLVTDPVSGALLDYGRGFYRPTAELAEFVVTRDRTCRFPTCSRPARLCDIDHAVPWGDGGTTSAHGCGALCRRNHRQKTRGGWQLHSHPDGTATFISPTGHVYRRPAVDHCPEHTAHIKALRAQYGDADEDLANATAQRAALHATEPSSLDADGTEQPTEEATADTKGAANGESCGESTAETTDVTTDESTDESCNDPPPF